LIVTSFVQIISGKSLGLFFKKGDTQFSLLLTKENYISILSAKAAEAAAPEKSLAGRLQMDPDHSYDQLRVAANQLSSAIIKHSKTFSPELLRRAETEVRIGKTDALKEIFNQVASSSAKGNDPDRIASLVELTKPLGRYQELLVDYSGAVATYQTALRLAPSNVLIAEALARNLIEGGRLADAQSVMNAVIDSARKQISVPGLAIALTTRAEIEMWQGNFSTALNDLTEATGLVEQAGIQDSEGKRQLANVLNLSAGLNAQIGNFLQAAANLQQSLSLSEDIDDFRAALNTNINSCKIMTDMGNIHDALIRCGKAESNVDQLAEWDEQRGYLFISKAYIFLRVRNSSGARTALGAASDFFGRLRSDVHATFTPLRIARLKCLEQRILYLEAKWDEVKRAGDECVEWTTQSSPGRLEDLIEAHYIISKANLKLGRIDEARLAATHVRLTNPGAPFFELRSTLMSSVADGAAAIASGDQASGRPVVDSAAQDLARLEHQSGALIGALDDALLLRDTGSIATDYLASVQSINALRAAFGARLLRQ
jgi:tetratricopeptide (TPR) repeat protein